MGKRRILLVDDEAAILKTIGKRLEVAGFEVLTAADGEAALTAARRERPDAIVLDLMLPQLNGAEVGQILKADPQYRQIPVIIFTGKGRETDEPLFRACGADAYVPKAIGFAELLAQLDTLLPPA